MTEPAPPPAVPCWRCRGCGQIANSERGEPWTDWMQLPLRSALAVAMGLVKPKLCPECRGSGRAPTW